MELFLLMGDDYRRRCRGRRRAHSAGAALELALDPETRRAIGRAWAAAGIGRNALVVARKPADG